VDKGVAAMDAVGETGGNEKAQVACQAHSETYLDHNDQEVVVNDSHR
jgi:hypothetical protein